MEKKDSPDICWKPINLRFMHLPFWVAKQTKHTPCTLGKLWPELASCQGMNILPKTQNFWLVFGPKANLFKLPKCQRPFNYDINTEWSFNQNLVYWMELLGKWMGETLTKKSSEWCRRGGGREKIFWLLKRKRTTKHVWTVRLLREREMQEFKSGV